VTVWPSQVIDSKPSVRIRLAVGDYSHLARSRGLVNFRQIFSLRQAGLSDILEGVVAAITGLGHAPQLL
jgi:hypothetical protein